MPTKRMLLERLKHDVEVKGEGDHNCFFEDVTVSQAERIKNGKRKTRFVLCCDDPDLCARLEANKDRIFRKVRNKAFMLSLMERALSDALSDRELDRILAAEEGGL